MNRYSALVAVVIPVLLAAPACVRHVHVHQPATYAPPPGHLPEGAGAEVEMFYDDLAPHGTWVRVEGPGWVWHPRGVPAGWRPYVDGRWIYTDYGWTWVSDESWGWAAYHYGRWHHAPRYGWVWVPGTEWGPAWVTWHAGGDWVGWAPLPWGVEWRAGIGLDWGRVDMRAAIDPAWWCFVPTRHLASPAPRNYFAPAARNVTIIKVTKNVTHYTIVENRIFNQGVSTQTVSRASGRPVPRFRVKEDASAREARGPRGHRMEGEELVVRRAAPRRAGPGAAVVAPPGHRKQTHVEPAESSAGRARPGATDAGDQAATPPARERAGSPPGRPARHGSPDDHVRRPNDDRAKRPQPAGPPQDGPAPAGPPQAAPKQAAPQPDAPPQGAAPPPEKGPGHDAPASATKPQAKKKPGRPGARGAKPEKKKAGTADDSEDEDDGEPKPEDPKSTRTGSGGAEKSDRP